MRIDSHQHFWSYSAAEYPWITPGSALEKDYLPADLKPQLDAARMDGCIAVQARQALVENDFLTSLAAKNSFVRGVVGWIDLRSEHATQQAVQFARQPKAVGVRHVVQDETDPEFMAREPFRRGLKALRSLDLVYDILIYEHQLADAIRLVRDMPDQRFVVDHIAKPRIKHGEIKEWSARITELAHYPNVVIKVSGILTEADHKAWTVSQLSPYWDITLQSFGPDRILFGSDWPVLRLAAEYARWVEIVEEWTRQLSRAEQGNVWGENAVRVYRLKSE
jgi:L-fuconolactonase